MEQRQLNFAEAPVQVLTLEEWIFHRCCHKAWHCSKPWLKRLKQTRITQI